jgi:hypothetical protein
MHAQEIAHRLLEDLDSYTTRLDKKQLDVYSSPEGTVATDGEVVVTWRLEEEHRSWGVKSLDPVIERVVGHLIVENGDAQQIDLNHFVVDSGWDNGEREMPPSIYPRRAEINVRQSTIKILF